MIMFAIVLKKVTVKVEDAIDFTAFEFFNFLV